MLECSQGALAFPLLPSTGHVLLILSIPVTASDVNWQGLTFLCGTETEQHVTGSLRCCGKALSKETGLGPDEG